MTYIITEFKALREAWPTWPALKDYLQSDAGGALGIRELDNGTRALIFYRRGVSNMNLSHMRWFRSVIWDTATNMPVCISTPKAIDEGASGGNVFEWTGADFEGRRVEEYLEGVTLNIYKDAAGTVQVSSRTCMGAGRGFYSRMSFREMLDDAMIATCNGLHKTVEEMFEDLTRVGSGNGHPWNFLTVLIQHPEHRVVTKVTSPCLHFLQRGCINADGTVEVEEIGPGAVEGPVEGETVATWFERLMMTRTWAWQGVVIHGSAGERWRIRSSVYHMIRSMRGSTNRSDERFFGLRAAGLIKTYLQYYPEDASVYQGYERWIRSMTNELFSYYVAVYKARSVYLVDIDARWHKHLGALHAFYLGNLKPTGRGLALADAIRYVNTLPTPRLLFLMNYDKRFGSSGA